jgi:CBS domain containing-hemolysin-like protein
MILILVAGLVATVELALVTFVQLLYLESLRLRPRDLPSVEFFKETLEDRIGLTNDAGDRTFSLIKHTTMVLLGVLCFAWIGELWQSAVAALLAMLGAGYALPQLLYRRTSGRWLLRLVRVLRAMAWVARPCVALMGFFQSLVELTDSDAAPEEPPTPAENVEALIDAGTEEGLIHEGDRELIQSVVEFGDKVVREVMTPRPRIVSIAAGATLEELRTLVINEQYSRIPVYEQNIDQIAGFVHVRDMFEVDEEERSRRLVRELLRPALFVPETKPVNDLMRQMQRENTHLAMVVDEYGNTAGLATMEDMLEAIIGEIRDEHEPGTDVVEDGRGGYLVSGSFDCDRIGDLIEGFRPGEEIESATVGGLVSEWLGRVPKAGEAAERGGIRIEVVAGDELRVERVRISKAERVASE